MGDDRELIGMYVGLPLLVHNRGVCDGQYCAVHNPSEHPLRDRPLFWRGHVMERICVHGVGHPDPDDLAWRRRTGQPDRGVHGCDGCCSGRRHPGAEPGLADDAGTAVAPWSPEQVDSLNAYQTAGKFHPYTCPNRGDGHHDGGTLVATTTGWTCPAVGCGYVQVWAYPFTTDWTWRQSGCATGL